MFGKFLHGLGGSAGSGDATKIRTLYEWRCERRASHDGNPLESDASEFGEASTTPSSTGSAVQRHDGVARLGDED